MSIEKNKDVIYRIVDGWNQGKEQEVIEEVFDTTQDAYEMAQQGYAVFRNAFPDIQLETQRLIEEGDWVAWHFTAKGTHKGEYLGVLPTGKHVEYSTMTFMHIVDGKLVGGWQIEDNLTLLKQLGAYPAEG